MSADDVKKLTVHQFNARMEFLNKIFPKEEDNPTEKPSQNYGVLDKAFGVR